MSQKMSKVYPFFSQLASREWWKDEKLNKMKDLLVPILGRPHIHQRMRIFWAFTRPYTQLEIFEIQSIESFPIKIMLNR